jgi:unsaturated chondroitin disaccharide hydrolase
MSRNMMILETSGRETIQRGIEFAAHQVRAALERNIDRDPLFYPMYTLDGKWRHGQESWTHWCEGFFPGMMWLLWEDTGQPYWREQAEKYSRPLEPRQFDDKVHDLGFIFLSTYLPWFRASGDKQIEAVLIQAGRTLATRYKEHGKYLSSFLAPESLFIDIMMNVGIIFHSAGLTKDRRLWDVAMNHCLTTRRYLVRGDGSTSHEGIFDLSTGEFLRQTTQQGYRNDSAWSRGLAWALYGFGTAYRYSRDERFLKTAEDCAAFYMSQTSSALSPWDYDCPAGPERINDTSADAIASAGLFRLARITGHEKYRNHATNVVERLVERFLADQTPGWEGVLRGGVYHKHKNLGVSESVSWGEYFFLEALLAAAGKDSPDPGAYDTWNT